MSNSRLLTTLWASLACYRDSPAPFIFIFTFTVTESWMWSGILNSLRFFFQNSQITKISFSPPQVVNFSEAIFSDRVTNEVFTSFIAATFIPKQRWVTQNVLNKRITKLGASVDLNRLMQGIALLKVCMSFLIRVLAEQALAHVDVLEFDTAKKSKLLTTDGQSVSLSWYRAPLWGLRPDVTSCRKVAVWKFRSCFCGASTLTRGRVCSLQCNHSMARVAQNP
jgi:hypothetical protein